MFRIAVSALILLGAFSSAAAETLVLEQGVDGYFGASDATIFEEVPENSAGGAPVLYVGITRYEDSRRGLLRFDLSAIPPGSVVEAAQLRLVVDRSRGFEEVHTLHRMTSAWNAGESFHSSLGEGGQGVPAAGGDATWLSSAHNELLWTSPGGDFVPEASASTILAGEGDVGVFADDALTADVQAWVNDSAENFGWVLIGDEEGYFNARRIHSAEGIEGSRPQLTITYSVPTGGGGWLLF